MRDPGLPRKPRRVHRTFQEQNFNKFAPKEVSLSLSLSLERSELVPDTLFGYAGSER
jgi:hypothetical protein